MNEHNIKAFLSALKDMGIDSYIFDREGRTTLPLLQKIVKNCRKCLLANTRKNVVFGEGNPMARLMFIGEAPGEEEDIHGKPFVGKAGKLLDQLIERIGLKRENVYICNVLKCRPPNNRDPEEEEIESCRGYLFSQIELIRPKIISTLGRYAYNTLFGVDERITKVRGKLKEYRGIKLLPTYHPSFLLRNQDKIKEAWDDMELLRKLLKV